MVYFCQNCGYPFLSRSSLEKHMLSAHRTTILFCDETSDSETDDQISLSSELAENYETEATGKEEIAEDNSCEICNKSFISRNNLSDHISTEHDDKSKPHNNCENCGEFECKDAALGDQFSRQIIREMTKISENKLKNNEGDIQLGDLKQIIQKTLRENPEHLPYLQPT